MGFAGTVMTVDHLPRLSAHRPAKGAQPSRPAAGRPGGQPTSARIAPETC